MPDVVQQGQGHFPAARVDGQGEVVHPARAAGDDVAHLVEHDGGTLAVGHSRIDRIQAARHVAAGQHQAVANAARSVGPEGRVELGLHVGRTQGGTGHPVSAGTAQADQAFIHGRTQARRFHRQPGPRAVILEAEHAVGTQIYRRTGTVAIGVGHGLHQGQHALTQGQGHTVIRIGGVAVPDVVQQGQGHFTGGRVDGQGKVVHPTGTAGNDVAHLIEHDGRTLAVGRGRIDRIQAARHVAAGQRQAVADAARPVSPEGRVELGLHVGRTQGGTGHPVSAGTAQADQAFIHGRTQARRFHRQPGPRAVILEAEHAVGTQIYRRTGAIAIGVGHGLHQGQHALTQRQRHTVIRIGGVAVPDIVQQGQGHFPATRVDGQGEVVHPTGAAGDDAAHLIEHDGGTLAVGRGRIDRIQAARHVAAGQRQAVANAASPVGPEGRVELGLYIGGAQGGTGHSVSAGTAQADQAFIYGHRAQSFRIGSKGDAGNIIQNDHIQAAAGIVTIGINQYDAETLTKRIIIGRLGMGFTPSQGVAVVHATSAGHGIVINAGNDQLVT